VNEVSSPTKFVVYSHTDRTPLFALSASAFALRCSSPSSCSDGKRQNESNLAHPIASCCYSSEAAPGSTAADSIIKSHHDSHLDTQTSRHDPEYRPRIRIRFRWMIDFQISTGDAHWPAFNVTDSLSSVGSACFSSRPRAKTLSPTLSLFLNPTHARPLPLHSLARHGITPGMLLRSDGRCRAGRRHRGHG
jgi:hypothetical protein